MNRAIKYFLIILLGMATGLGVSVGLILLGGNSYGLFVPVTTYQYITSAGEGWVFFYPIVDSYDGLVGNFTVASGVPIPANVPCSVYATLSWGTVIKLERVHLDSTLLSMKG